MNHTPISIRKRLSFFLLSFIFFCSCFVTGGVIVTDVYAVTQAEIDALQSEAKDLTAAQKELEVQISALANDMSNATYRKKLIEQEITLLEQEIRNTEEQINLFDGLILLKVQEIQEAELEERRQYDLFCQRVRTMEEAGDVSYWSILFQASNFSDLLDRIVMIDEIMEYDNLVMDQLIAIRQRIISEREELELLRQDQEAIFLQQQEAKVQKLAQEAEIDKLIAAIAAQEAELASIQAALEAAAADMDAKIRQKEAELAAQLAALGNTIISESGFMWPLPAYNTLTSLFGGRISPITGRAETHTGIDIPAPSGTPIQAAKSGIVLTSEYHYSYGNYVVVSHGNGQTTLYAHMVSRGLAEGTMVNQGDVVGYVGTTGDSTGNHLHYEIRFNGSRADPLNYYTDKTLYYRSGGVTVLLQ